MGIRGLALKAFGIVVLLGASLWLPFVSQADPVTWATWTAATIGSTETVSGTMGAINVRYIGQVYNFKDGYPQWLPSTSYTGGDVSNAPPLGFYIGISGGPGTGAETIIFSSRLLKNP